MGFKKETEIYITKAEKVFASSWKVLIAMKDQNTNKEDVISLIEFQSNLANILFSLEKLRHKIIQEEKRIVKNKNIYNAKWFIKRLRLLGSYKKAIEKVSNIGKALGDAFAYWFYREDLELLEEHRSHVKIKHFPTGTGAIGEIEFIEKIKHLDNKLVIYHGTTTILRIGDVSLFDLENMQIVALGDLKTKKIGINQITVNLILFSPKARNVFEVKNIGKAEPFEYFDNARLKRQINSMTKALRIYDPQKDESHQNIDKDLYDKFNTKKLDELHSISNFKKLSSLKVSDSIIFTGFKDNTRAFKDKFLKNRQYHPTEDDKEMLVNLVKQIMKPESPNNGIIITELLYTENNEVYSARGTVPLFWLPISNDVLKEIYFNTFFVGVLFNPVYLIDTLIQKGFHLKSKYYHVTDNLKDNKNGLLRIEGFDLFIPYIIHHLQSENSIIETIEIIQKEVKTKKIKQNMGFQIKMQQILFSSYKKNSR